MPTATQIDVRACSGRDPAPPTPAFSDLVQPEPTIAYMVAEGCQAPAYAQGTILGWDHGLNRLVERIASAARVARMETHFEMVGPSRRFSNFSLGGPQF
jgi:hypothetical protein